MVSPEHMQSEQEAGCRVSQGPAIGLSLIQVEMMVGDVTFCVKITRKNKGRCWLHRVFYNGEGIDFGDRVALYFYAWLLSL